jgi:hypothetical protein
MDIGQDLLMRVRKRRKLCRHQRRHRGEARRGLASDDIFSRRRIVHRRKARQRGSPRIKRERSTFQSMYSETSKRGCHDKKYKRELGSPPLRVGCVSTDGRGRAARLAFSRPHGALAILPLMSEANPELERLRAKRTNRALGRLGYLTDRRSRLRVIPEFFQIGLRPLATLGTLLDGFGFLQVYSSLK